MSLENIALVTDALSRRSSSWDRTGGNIDCVTGFEPGATTVLLETDGPGKITHMWITVMENGCQQTIMRDLVLRMYWEGSATPSVEVPLGDFFGLGHALPPPFYERRGFKIISAPINVGTNERAFNCYWPMPFHRSARIEIYNNGSHTVKQVYFHVDYELAPQPPESALFHAEFRQEKNLSGQVTGDDYVNLYGEENYVLFETTGRGQYVGCFLYIDAATDGWWGEGDDMIFIDHDKFPALIGTGSEDYFNNAWCFHNAFTFPYYGCPLLEKRADGGTYTSLYRFHGPDPIRFREHIKVTIERWWETYKTNNFASVAFWYQQQPITSRKPLPVREANYPVFHQLHPDDYRKPAAKGVDLLGLEVPLRASGLEVKVIAALGQEFLHDGGALLVTSNGKPVTVPLPVPRDGLYRVEVKPVYGLIEGELTLSVEGEQPVKVRSQKFRRENDGAMIIVGSARAQNKAVALTVTAPGAAPLHYVVCQRLD